MGNMIQSACDTMPPKITTDKGKTTLTHAHMHTTQVTRSLGRCWQVSKISGRCRQVSQKVLAGVSTKYGGEIAIYQTHTPTQSRPHLGNITGGHGNQLCEVQALPPSQRASQRLNGRSWTSGCLTLQSQLMPRTKTRSAVAPKRSHTLPHLRWPPLGGAFFFGGGGA